MTNTRPLHSQVSSTLCSEYFTWIRLPVPCISKLEGRWTQFSLHRTDRKYPPTFLNCKITQNANKCFKILFITKKTSEYCALCTTRKMCTMLHFEIGQRVRYTFFCYTAFTENPDSIIYHPKYWYAWALVSKKNHVTRQGIKPGCTMCKTTEKLQSLLLKTLTSYKVQRNKYICSLFPIPS